MRVDRANQSTAYPRQFLIFVAGLAASVLIPACERTPPRLSDRQVRANLVTVRSWPGSPLPVGAARFRASDGRLVPEFADVNDAATARVTLPDRADGQAHVEDRATGLAIDITLIGADITAGQVVDGYVVYPKVHSLGWVYQRAEPSGVEDYLVLDERPASPSIAYDVKLGPHVAGLRLVENQLEMLDASGAPRLRLAPPYVVGSDGARTDAFLAVEGCAVDADPAGPWGRAVTPAGPTSCRVVVSWVDDGVSYPALLDPRWQTTGSLSVARQDHNLVYLPLTGKVLAVGGRSSPTSTTGLATAELFDSNSRTWSATSSMRGGRWSASATLLGASANGTTSQKVLIAGGINGTASVNTAQLYNQTAGTWGAAGTMNAPRHLHTATLLNDGRVLVCGGMNGTSVLTSAALYTPASGSGSWAATTGPIPPPGWRSGTATLIQTSNNELNNKVLLAGGNNGTDTTSAAFLFDPAQSAFSTLASMPSPREGHKAVALSDGRILYAGGKSGATTLASAVIFDPSWGPGNWNTTGNMTSPRWGHAMNLLPSGVLTQGLVLVSGGSNGTSTLSSTEYWNGISWATDGAMVAPVQQHASVALGNSILVAGGAINNGSTAVSAAEVYDPSIGLGCTSGNQCASGFCVAGVCCDSACNGGCGACNMAGHVGTCTAVASGPVCRSAAGICDVAEACDGSSLACPTDEFQSSTTICRESGGSCDLAETCTGTSAACPADAFQPATTVCRPSAGGCDIAEKCTADNVDCPADTFEPVTTECRPSAGVCDVAESCTGTSATCPADGFQPGTTACRPSAGICDFAESCTGSGSECPTDQYLPPTTACRASAGICDLAESCTGDSAACPVDAFQSATAVCRASAGVCDIAESCTGTGAACPVDIFQPATTVCRAAMSQCDIAELCTGSSAACSPDAFQPEGTSCNDGNACTQTDTCQAGTCTGANPVSCTASDQCHVAGICDPTSGTCSNPAQADGTSCSDGDACTQTDTCQAGTCTGANPVSCTASDQCHVAGTCDPTSGACSNPAQADGTSCSDGDACTQTDTCQAGTCTGANPVSCVASDQCHEAGICEGSTGQCSQPTKPDGTACDDGDPSTQDDVCTAGICAGNPQSTCWAVATIDAGGSFSCSTWTDNGLWCWGTNNYGQLGDGTYTGRTMPTRVNGSDWSKVFSGYAHTCAVAADGRLWCWGANDSGQLGDGTTSRRAVPTLVSSSVTTWASIGVGTSHTCGTTSEGSLYCWGYNWYGQLGDGTQTQRLTPRQVSGTDWATVTAGQLHTCATKMSGALYCWGNGFNGELGNGIFYPSLTPVYVGADFASVNAGSAHNCAIKTDTTLRCWGNGADGQVGYGGTSNMAVPTTVDGTGWANVSAGDTHTCGTKTDGTLYCWGSNGSGRLGDGTTTRRLIPTLALESGWERVSAGYTHTCARKADDSVWCWGANSSGQLGDGTTTSRIVPTQIAPAGCKGMCGDGRQDWDEECDDGNRTNFDGCSSTCFIELCGNGTFDPGEECDDGNHVDGDGCSHDCRLDGCGNGVVEAGEECDDGGRVDGDGCSSNCLLEVCGNARVDFGEECDDGNQVDDDACSNVCRRNLCFGVQCAPSGSPCATIACNPATGTCESTPTADGTPCDDLNACTQADACQSGQCAGTQPLDCTAKTPCQLDGTCDTVRGCIIPRKPDGSSCDDENACTISDACEAGECVGVVTSTCFASHVPAASPTVPTTTAGASSFLYTGPDAVQTGMAPTTIDPVRAAVLRGHVRDRVGDPISGVKITIAGHGEFGQTRTRDDGWFDMAVNGGGRLHLVYEKRGYLRVDRDIEVAWQDISVVPEVVMLALDPAVTTIDLPASGLQVARGSVVTDEDGSRQAAVFFPAGVQATDAAHGYPMNRLSVRATEYTVGPDGPAAMPATLPSNSGYTYAVELSVDEAIAEGILKVEFSQPVYLYVNNFINLPVGASAPLGTYDRLANSWHHLNAWTPSPSGRVVKILQVLGGRAVLAVDGTGLPATSAALAALGVTDEELEALAASYAEGETLWRVPILHFSPHDVNFPYGYPHGIEYPRPGAPEQEPCDPCSQEAQGSIIECENQVLGQRIPVAGTPFSLEYRSRHTGGDRRPSSLSLAAAPLSPAAQALLKEVVVKTRVAGQEIEQRYDKTSYPGTAPRFDFSWNGNDAYGRGLQGAQEAQVTLGYVYPIFYRSQADLDIIFGEWATPPASIVSRSAATVTLLADASNTAGLRGSPRATLGSLRPPRGELGGWTLNVHHFYDPQMRVLYLGDGRIQSAEDVKQVVTLAAGNGASVVAGQFVSGQAKNVPVQFWWNEPSALTATPTGDVFFSDANFLGRIDRVGNLTRFGYRYTYVRCLTSGYDGALYFAEENGSDRGKVMRALPPFAGNDLNVTEYLIAPGESIWGIAPSPDGTIYVMAGSSFFPSQDPKSRILKRTPDGQVRQVAGASSRGYSPDGTPAAEARLTIYDVAAGPDGSLYVSEGTRIRRIGPDGILTTVAGTGTSGYTGDGGSALAARIWGMYLRVGADGTIYLSDGATIRRIAADGVISTLIGNGQTGGVVDGASARGPLSISAFSVAPDSSLYFVEAPNPSVKRIWRAAPPLPGYEAKQTVLASRDGSEHFVFSVEGRHLRTNDALTGALKYQFEYDDEGFLGGVVDGDNLRTAIVRDSAGRPTAIMSPTGQQTALTLDPNGYLASISDPGGNAYDFTYQPNGLMATLTDPRRNVHSFEFDEMGRLERDSDPSGGFTTLAREGDSKDYTVTKATAENRVTAYRVESFVDGSSRKRTTDPAGLVTARSTDPTGGIVWSSPDGSTGTVTLGPDPLLGMQAPLARSRVTRLPSGSQMTLNMSRAVTQGESGELTGRVDTITLNAKPFTSTYSVAARTVTSVSPMGRQTVTTFDDKGRVVGVQAANLAPAGYDYDSRGRLTSITVGTGASSRVTTFAYDELDRLTSVTDPLTRVHQYSYDDANRVVGQTFTDESQVAFGYDANSNVTSVTPPGRPEHAFGFTPNDLMSSYTPPVVAGTVATTYEYNLDKQPTVIHRPDGSTIHFTYDSAGRLSTTTYPKGPEASDGTVTVTRTYSPTTGQLTGVTTSDGQSLAYGYDGNLVTSTTWSGNVAGSVGWTYNNDFRVASQTVNGANSVAFGYDNDGLLTSVDGLTITRDSMNGLITDTTLGQVTDHRTYDPVGKLATYEAKFGTTSLYSVAYVRDALDRIEQRTETIQGTTTVWNYSYDSTGRLWQVMQNGVLTATYLYDANGNRTSVTTPGGTQAATYDAQDCLLTYGNSAYTYTPNGDLRSRTDTTTGQVTSYAYDGQGNLRHVGLPDGRAIDYLVDSENRRVAKKVNGAVVRRWIYEDQLKPVAEFDGSGTLLARYLDGVTIKSGTSYRVVSDHLGTPRLLVSSTTGAVAQMLDVDEWGQVTADSGVAFQAFGFGGGIYDSDTGLVRFGSRDYDPGTGRWAAKDPIIFAGRDSDLYGYVMNDPVNIADPTGEVPFGNFVRGKLGQLLAAFGRWIAGELPLEPVEPLKRRPTPPGDFRPPPEKCPLPPPDRLKSVTSPLLDLLDFNGDGLLDYQDVFEAANPFGPLGIPLQQPREII